MADIPVISPDGERGTVPSEKFNEAIAKGFKVEDVAETIARREQETAALQPVRAGVEGLLRGGTLGLSDVLQRAATAEEDQAQVAREALARREANPYISGGTELLGGLATSLATGGLGTAGLGTAAAARLGGGALAKVAGTALASGLETAAFGAGTEASQAALENRALRAEKLLASMGIGAAMGGVGAGLLGVGGIALKRLAARKAAAAAAKEGVAGVEGALAREGLEGAEAAAAQAAPTTEAEALARQIAEAPPAVADDAAAIARAEQEAADAAGEGFGVAAEREAVEAAAPAPTEAEALARQIAGEPAEALTPEALARMEQEALDAETAAAAEGFGNVEVGEAKARNAALAEARAARAARREALETEGKAIAEGVRKEEADALLRQQLDEEAAAAEGFVSKAAPEVDEAAAALESKATARATAEAKAAEEAAAAEGFGATVAKEAAEAAPPIVPGAPPIVPGAPAVEAAAAKPGAATAKAVADSLPPPEATAESFVDSLRQAAGKQIGTKQQVATQIHGRINEAIVNQKLAAMGFIKSNLNKLLKLKTGAAAEAKIADIANTITELKLVGKISSPRDNLKRTLEAVDMMIGRSDSLWDQAGAASGKTLDADNAIAAIKKMFGGLDELEAQAAGPARAQAEALQSMLERMAKRPQGISFLEARQVGTRLDGMVKKAFKSQDPSAEILRDLRNAYRNNIMDQVEAAAGKELRQEIATTNRHLSNLYSIEDAGQDALRRSGNRGISLSDYITGVGLSFGDPLSGIAIAGANKLMREYGASVSIGLLEAAAKHPFIDEIAGGISGIGRALAGKGTKEGAEGFAQAMRLVKQAQKVSSVMNKGVEAIFTGAPAVTKRQASQAIPAIADMLGIALDETADAAGQFHVAKDKFTELANDPEKMMDRMQHAMEVEGVADPDAAPQFAMAAANAVRYLQSVMPRAPTPDSMLGAKPWRPSDAQLHEFKTAVNMVVSPLDSLEKMRDGTLTNKDVEALQAVYPSLYAQMRQKVVETAQASEEKLTYSRRLSVGRFLQGQSIERTLDPAYVATMQQNFIGSPPPEEQAQGAPPSMAMASTKRPASAKTPQTARFAITESQRIEAKGAQA